MFWYDINKTLTYNALFNMVVGPRGTGKTYGAKKWGVKDFLKTGGQFIYLRRYKPELRGIKSFFSDLIINNEFPDHELEVKGNDFLVDGKPAGQAMALSSAKKSVPYPMVNKIIFDEFIIATGQYHYLPNEVIAFLEFYETVARLRDNVRAFLLSNAITQSNPYFMYFKLRLPRNSNFARNGDILLEFVDNPEFTAAKKQTRFGKLIEDTEYGRYAIDNEFLLDNRTFIEKKGENAQYLFTMKYKGESIGVWIDYQAGKIWCSPNIDPSYRTTYVLTQSDHSPNTMLIQTISKSPIFKILIDNYKLGNVYFENITVKNLCFEAIRLIVTK